MSKNDFLVTTLAALWLSAGCAGDTPMVPVPTPRVDPGQAGSGPTPAPVDPAGTDCGSDRCFRRELDGAGACVVVERLGRPVYERHDSGWHYSFDQPAGAKLAFRAVGEDHPLQLLHASGIGVKMLSTDPNEASSCDWCACATDCAFRQTGVVISTSATQLPGTVALVRYCDGSVDQRESLTPLDGWEITPGQDHGFVCPP